MSRHLHANDEGGMAIEFAFILPLIILFAVGSLQVGMAIWRWNALQGVAETTARCVAIGATTCGTVTSGCGSSDAGICYAQQVGTSRGISDLSASAISVDRAVTQGSLTFTTVSITDRISLLSLSWNVAASASFPNN